MTNAQQQLEQFSRQFFRKREIVDPVPWLCRNVQLLDKETDYKGPFSVDNCPDIKEIIRACVGLQIGQMTEECERAQIESVVIVGPTQSFKTTILIGVALYTVTVDPGGIGWVMPSEPLGRDFSKLRLQPTVRNSPEVAKLILDNPDDFKTLQLGFKTCTLRIAGAHSPGNLASFSYKRVIGDETDKFPQLLKSEAGTLDLMMQRTGQYLEHSHIFASTPTVPTGTIWQEALRGDCRRYHVPCPHCSELFSFKFTTDGTTLVWDQSAKNANGTWDLERVAKTAHYRCPKCQNEIWEHHRRDMLHAGKWIPDPKEQADDARANYDIVADPYRRSYFRSCFNVLHPNRTFAKIAQKHLLAGRDPSKRQNFTNSELGEVHEEAGETVDWQILQKRAESYLDDGKPLILPDGVRVLTAGIDIQANPPRAEVEIVGWGRDFESWGIQYAIIPRNAGWKQMWDDVDRLLTRQWTHERGFTLNVAATCVDTGHEPEEVYKWVARCQPRRVYAVKGSSEGYGTPLLSRPQKSGVKKATLYMVGTITAKEMIYARMRIQEPGPGCMHFPIEPKRGYDAEWFRQVTAEKCVERYVAGRKTKKFVKPSGRANEALDIRCYSLAALHRLNPDFDEIEKKISGDASTPAEETKREQVETERSETVQEFVEQGSVEGPPTEAAPSREPEKEAAERKAPEEPSANTYKVVAGNDPAQAPRPLRPKVRFPRSSWATRW